MVTGKEITKYIKNTDTLPLVKYPWISPQKSHFNLCTETTPKIYSCICCTALGRSQPL